MKIVSLLLSLFLITSYSLNAESHKAKRVKLRLAIFCTSSSTWKSTLDAMDKDLKKATGGRIGLKSKFMDLKADEVFAIQKMNTGRYHGANLSIVGLSQILPSFYALESPLIFHNDKEVDYVQSQLFEHFYKELWDKGFVLLGFTGEGLSYLFSRSKWDSRQPAKNLNVWLPQNDKGAKTLLNTWGVTPISLHISKVKNALIQNQFEYLYAPAQKVLQLNWDSHLKYRLELPIINSIGALILKRRVFDKLSINDQDILKKLSKRSLYQLQQLNRTESQKAINKLVKKGLSSYSPSEADKGFMRDLSNLTFSKNIDKLFSFSFIDQVKKLVVQYRSLTSKGKVPQE